MKIEKIFLFVAFSALAAGVVMLIMGVLKKDYEPNQYQDAAVVIAVRDLPADKLITRTDLTTVKVPLSEPNAVLESDMAGIPDNYVTKINIPRGNQITRDMMGKKDAGAASAVLKQGARGYAAPAGITVDGAERVKDFSVGGRSYTLWSVTPEAAQGMLLKEVSAGGDR